MTKKPNVFVFFLDTVRVDHIQGLNEPLKVKNFIEKKIHQTALFSQVCVGGNSTRISVNSVFHGFYGRTSGFNFHYGNESQYDHSAVISLADVFRYNGYYTVALSQGDVYTPTLGFDRYEAFSDSFHHAQTQSDVMSQDKPVFAYFHFLNLHDEAFGRPELMTSDYYQQQWDALAEEVETVWQRWIKDGDIVLMVSDHGCHLRETFDPQWRYYHEEEPTGGIYLSENTTRGFYAFCGANYFPQFHSRELVRGIDIFPTLLDALAFDYPQVQGRSLWPYLSKKQSLAELTGFSEAGGVVMQDGESISRCLKKGRWKYCRYETKGEFLFNILDDPNEGENLRSINTEQFSLLKGLFEQQVSQNRLGYKHYYRNDWALYQQLLNARKAQPTVMRGSRGSCFKNMLDVQAKQHLYQGLLAKLDTWLAAGERVAVYSASEHAKAFLNEGSLPEKHPLIAVIDGNPALAGGEFCGLPVVNVSEVEALYEPSIVVIAHYFYANDMAVTLKEQLCKPVRVFNAYRIDEELSLWWDIQ